MKTLKESSKKLRLNTIVFGRNTFRGFKFAESRTLLVLNFAGINFRDFAIFLAFAKVYILEMIKNTENGQNSHEN